MQGATPAKLARGLCTIQTAVRHFPLGWLGLLALFGQMLADIGHLSEDGRVLSQAAGFLELVREGCAGQDSAFRDAFDVGHLGRSQVE